MSPLERSRTDGMFTARGKRYSDAQRLVLMLEISERMRGGLKLREAVATVVDHDAELSGIRLTKEERAAAIKTGYRRYHEWRPAILSECDEERITRENFERIGLIVNEIEFRGVEPLGSNTANAILRPLEKRGRPRTSKKR